jgi:hypothetical protein
MGDSLAPFTQRELFDAFAAEHGSISKHLLTLYSLAVGVNAQRAIELGVGNSTRALRAAMLATGGKLLSNDIDELRFADAARSPDAHWELALCPSTEFLSSLSPPFDFCLHDAAHDYWQVVSDLRALLPLMRQYALVCVHDTQHSSIGEQMVHAIEDAVAGHGVSYVHLPFCFGLTIIRLEASPHPAIPSPWRKNEKASTSCFPTPLVRTGQAASHSGRYIGDKLRGVARRLLGRR